MKTKLLIPFFLIIFYLLPTACLGQMPDLGTASNFIIFSSDGALSNTGASVVGGGMIGTGVGAVTGFDNVNWIKHIGDDVTTQCSKDLTAAYNEINAYVANPIISLPLGETYTAGVYSINSSVTLKPTLTLDAQNNPNAIFVFKVEGEFSAAANTHIILINGAVASNVFWNVKGAIHMGANTSLKGNFISLAGAITLGTGTSLEGRLLTLNGAVSLYENIVMNHFPDMPTITLIQPNSTIPTGTITVTAPTGDGLRYSIDGSTYTNTTGVFSGVAPGPYIVSVKDASGAISAVTSIKIIPFLNFGAASSFALFTITGDVLNVKDVENTTALTSVTGDVGTNKGAFNFNGGKICGNIEVQNEISSQAATDLALVNADLTKNIPDSTISTTFGNGQVLTPKVYGFGAALVLTGDLILDAQGDPNALFVFQIGGAFSTGVSSRIIMRNAASMCNVYWQIVGATTLGVHSVFRGTLVVDGAIVFLHNSTLYGRALSTTGAITLNENENVNILPTPSVTLIQPTSKVNSGTISITAPVGLGLKYSIDGCDYSNTTGIFTHVPVGTYTVTARNTECSSCPGTFVTIGQPTWTGAVSSDWNNPNNWSPNSVPTEDQDLVIPDVRIDPVIIQSLPAVCTNLKIKEGAVLTISCGGELRVNEAINNQAGASGLVIKASPVDGIANGTLIFHNMNDVDESQQAGERKKMKAEESESSVLATVEMYTKASWDKNQADGNIYKWQFFGIPLQSMKANPTFAGSFVRRYCESGLNSAAHWVQQQNDSTLTPFTGYEIVQKEPKIITFTGKLVNKDLSNTFTYTSEATYPGQHLIGNPYTAAIDISKLEFGDDVEKSVYLYNTGSYTDWENSVNVKDDFFSPGQYTVSTIETAVEGTLIPGTIPSMQAFLVIRPEVGTDFNFKIPYSSVTQNVDKQRAPAANKVPLKKKVFTRIDVSGSRFSDRMWIFSDSVCTHNFDNGWDGRKFLGSFMAPQLFAMEADGDYQINAVDDINNTELGFRAGEDLNYVLTFTHQNMEASCSGLFLLDLKENTVMNITKSGTEYPFLAEHTETAEKRFVILTSPALSDSEEKNMQLKIFTIEQKVIIHNLNRLVGELEFYDITGRFMQKSSFGVEGVTVIQTYLPSGAYFAKVLTENGEQIKRFFIP